MAKNDPPSNRRMGFGYKEAQDAGVPFLAPRSGRAMNAEANELAAGYKLHELIKKDENLGPRIAKMLQSGKSAQEILVELTGSKEISN